MQVGAGHRNKVFDPAGHRTPQPMDRTTRDITILHRFGDDADGKKVVNLVNRDALPQQLLMDTVVALDAALYPRIHAVLFQLFANHAFNLLQKVLTALAPRLDSIVHPLVTDGIPLPKRQTFQLAAHLAPPPPLPHPTQYL